jgi:hypothetical protein
MSDVNLNFVVENNNIGFTVEPNDITITPEEIQLTFTSGSTSVPGGTNTQLQYNNNGLLDGIPNVTFNGSNISLGNVSTVKITGGTNGFVLQTDGTGNLDWTAMTGGGGNGSPGGSNTQIQYNDNGLFGGNAGFTFNEVTGNVSIPGNLSVVGSITGSFVSNYSNFAGQVVDATQSNITSLGNLTSLTVQGTTVIQQAKEKVVTSATAASGTVNYDFLNQSILYYTSNASSNFTLNIRGNVITTFNDSVESNQSVTLRFINTTGAVGYYANTIQIDGSNITPKWLYQSGSPTSAIASGLDVYDLNIIKTANATYTVLAIQTGYQ